MKVLIASKNYIKIEGAKKALQRYFENVEIEGIPVSSEVNEQPVNEDIYLGAKNRLNNLFKYAKQKNIKADLYMSIESGIYKIFNKWFITNVAIISDNNYIENMGISPSFPVPEKYVKKIIKTDLNKAIKDIYKINNDCSFESAIQLLTHNEITRIDITEIAFIMALTQYINNQWK